MVWVAVLFGYALFLMNSQLLEELEPNIYRDCW